MLNNLPKKSSEIQQYFIDNGSLYKKQYNLGVQIMKNYQCEVLLCISTHLAALHSFILACLLTSLLLRKEKKKRTGTKASAFVSYQVFLMGGIKRVKIVTPHRPLDLSENGFYVS
jgi:hypothetical protein